MTIGIIVAMSSELACVKDLLDDCREEQNENEDLLMLLMPMMLND